MHLRTRRPSPAAMVIVAKPRCNSSALTPLDPPFSPVIKDEEEMEEEEVETLTATAADDPRPRPSPPFHCATTLSRVPRHQQALESPQSLGSALFLRR